MGKRWRGVVQIFVDPEVGTRAKPWAEGSPPALRQEEEMKYQMS